MEQDLLQEIKALESLIADLRKRIEESVTAEQPQPKEIRKPKGQRISLKAFIQKEFGDCEIADMLYTKQRLLQIMRIHNCNAYNWFVYRFHDAWRDSIPNGAQRRSMIEQYLIAAFCKFHKLEFIKRDPARVGEHLEGKHKGYYAKLEVIEETKQHKLLYNSKIW